MKTTVNKNRVGEIVFKASELQDGSNPIGVIIDVYDDGEYRTDMFGNTCDIEVVDGKTYGECRPATPEEIAEYRPELLSEVRDNTQVSVFVDETGEKRIFSGATLDNILCEIEFLIYPEIESSAAKATAHVKDNELVKITFPFKIPRGYYYSFLNDALEAFSEQYPEYR